MAQLATGSTKCLVSLDNYAQLKLVWQWIMDTEPGELLVARSSRGTVAKLSSTQSVENQSEQRMNDICGSAAKSNGF